MDAERQRYAQHMDLYMSRTLVCLFYFIGKNTSLLVLIASGMLGSSPWVALVTFPLGPNDKVRGILAFEILGYFSGYIAMMMKFKTKKKT